MRILTKTEIESPDIPAGFVPLPLDHVVREGDYYRGGGKLASWVPTSMHTVSPSPTTRPNSAFRYIRPVGEFTREGGVIHPAFAWAVLKLVADKAAEPRHIEPYYTVVMRWSVAAPWRAVRLVSVSYEDTREGRVLAAQLRAEEPPRTGETAPRLVTYFRRKTAVDAKSIGLLPREVTP